MLAWLLLMTVSADSAAFVFHAGGVCEVDARTAFAYDAVEAKGRRAQARIYHGSEDVILDAGKRAKVQANARDIRRNFAIAAWMIRKHLDYVASFRFHCRSGDTSLDEDVEGLMTEWSKRENFDVAGRHRLSRMLRLTEAMATLDGDFGLVKLASGHVQGIESDRIRNPMGTSGVGGKWIHGVEVNEYGRALRYAIHRRVGAGSFQFERAVPAENFLLHAKYDRHDQVRGISPIVAALNPLRDTYESIDYAQARAKVAQLFAFAIYREAYDTAGQKRDDGTIDFGRGPVHLELNHGDKAEFLESKTPSTEFQAFTSRVIDIALKALDIPYSFYDEAHTNFFGSRAAWLHYERSCLEKRADLLEILDALTHWRLTNAWLDGELQLPSGWTVADLGCEWVPTGMPWWDPAKEIRGDLMAIEAGFDTYQSVTKKRGGGDWYWNIERNAEARKFAETKGIVLPGAGPEPAVVEVQTDA